MDATQFVGIVEPCRAPDHSHTYDEVGYIVEGKGFAHIGGESIPAPARLLLSPATRAGSLHREHGAGRHADPRRLPSLGRSGFTGVRGQLATDSSVLARSAHTTGGQGMHGSKRKGAAAFAVLDHCVARGRRVGVCAGRRRADGRGGPERVLRRTRRSASWVRSPGDAAFIGKEQLGFAQVRDPEARQAARSSSSRTTRSSTRPRPRRPGRKFHANANVLAVVGPAGSQEVLAVAPIFKKAQRLPFISGSATAHVADERLDPELLPGRAERQRPGADDREVHPADPEGEGASSSSTTRRRTRGRWRTACRRTCGPAASR